MRRRTSACYVAIDQADECHRRLLHAGRRQRSPHGPVRGDDEEAAALSPRAGGASWPPRGEPGLSEATARRGVAVDAGLRAMQSGMGVFALVVDAKDETAAAFYKRHGFVGFSSSTLTFVLPIATLAKKN